jgi:hypothetical protein
LPTGAVQEPLIEPQGQEKEELDDNDCVCKAGAGLGPEDVYQNEIHWIQPNRIIATLATAPLMLVMPE